MTELTSLSLELLVFLGGALLLILSAYGGILKYLYDQQKKHDHTLNGTNGNLGFIEEQRHTNAQVLRSQEEIERSLQAHGALLQELVYILNDMADSLDEEDLDNVDIRRLEYLQQSIRRQTMANSRYGNQYSPHPQQQRDNEQRDDD